MTIDSLLYGLVRSVQFFVPASSTRTRVGLVCGRNILLVKNRIGPDKWTLPGGGVKKGEDVKESACREVKEELAVEIKPRQLRSAGTSEHKTGLYKESYEVYVCRISALRFKAQRREIRAARWFELESLPRKRTDLVDQALKQYS